MKRTRIHKPKVAREHPWHEVLPADPRDPDVVGAMGSPAQAPPPGADHGPGGVRRRLSGRSLAHSVTAVTTARAVMGTGAAVIMPATVSLLLTMEPR